MIKIVGLFVKMITSITRARKTTFGEKIWLLQRPSLVVWKIRTLYGNKIYFGKVCGKTGNSLAEYRLLRDRKYAYVHSKKIITRKFTSSR